MTLHMNLSDAHYHASPVHQKCSIIQRQTNGCAAWRQARKLSRRMVCQCCSSCSWACQCIGTELNTCLSQEVHQTHILAQDGLSHVTTKCSKGTAQHG
jgi:hypothetical protein